MQEDLETDLKLDWVAQALGASRPLALLSWAELDDAMPPSAWTTQSNLGSVCLHVRAQLLQFHVFIRWPNLHRMTLKVHTRLGVDARGATDLA